MPQFQALEHGLDEVLAPGRVGGKSADRCASGLILIEIGDPRDDALGFARSTSSTVAPRRNRSTGRSCPSRMSSTAVTSKSTRETSRCSSSSRNERSRSARSASNATACPTGRARQRLGSPGRRRRSTRRRGRADACRTGPRRGDRCDGPLEHEQRASGPPAGRARPRSDVQRLIGHDDAVLRASFVSPPGWSSMLRERSKDSCHCRTSVKRGARTTIRSMCPLSRNASNTRPASTVLPAPARRGDRRNARACGCAPPPSRARSTATPEAEHECPSRQSRPPGQIAARAPCAEILLAQPPAVAMRPEVRYMKRVWLDRRPASLAFARALAGTAARA